MEAKLSGTLEENAIKGTAFRRKQPPPHHLILVKCMISHLGRLMPVIFLYVIIDYCLQIVRHVPVWCHQHTVSDHKMFVAGVVNTVADFINTICIVLTKAYDHMFYLSEPPFRHTRMPRFGRKSARLLQSQESSTGAIHRGENLQ